MNILHILNGKYLNTGWMFVWRSILALAILEIPVYLVFYEIFSLSPKGLFEIYIPFLMIPVIIVADGLAYNSTIIALDNLKHKLRFIDWLRINYKDIFNKHNFMVGWMIFWREILFSILLIGIPFFLFELVLNYLIKLYFFYGYLGLIYIIYLIYSFYIRLCISGVVFINVRKNIHTAFIQH
jgi:hypothetical protein